MESVSSPESEAPKKPALLKGGMIVCWIYAVVLLLTLAMLPVLSDVRGMETNATVALPGDAVLHAKFAAVTATSPLFVIPLLVLSVVVAYGLAKNRHWSRMMMMTLLILGVVLIPPDLASPVMSGVSVAVAVFGWWYLYRKKNVVEYYLAIRPKRVNRN